MKNAPFSEAQNPGGTEQAHIKDFIRIVVARRWVGISVFVLVVAGALLYVLMQTPIYRATGMLLIEPGKVNMGPSQDLDLTLDYAPGYLDRREYYETQYRLLSSYALHEKVFHQLEFGEVPGFKDVPQPVEKFGRFVSVHPVAGTRLVQVSFEWPEPELAARTVTALLEQFVVDHRSRTQGITLAGLQALRAKRDELRPKLEATADELQDFMLKSGVVSLEERSDIIVQRLRELQESVSSTERSYFEGKSRYDGMQEAFVRTTDLRQVPDLLANSSVVTMEMEVARLQQQISDLSEKFGPKHPELQAANARLTEAMSKLESEIRQSLATAKAQYEQTGRELEALRKQLASQEQTALQVNRQRVRYEQLRREHDLLRKTFLELSKRVEDVEITLQTGSSHDNVMIVEQARVPVYPAKPKRGRILAAAMLLALGLAIGMCFLIDYLDTTIKTKEDVVRTTGLNVIGYVPAIREADMRSGSGSDLPLELLPLQKPRAPVAEAFRSIRTAIDFSAVDKRFRRLLVSSSSPSEGKSLSSSNIALTMAQAGRKVLLIDADMRRHRVHKVFGVSSSLGLSNCLIAADMDAEIAKSAQPVPQLEALSVMSSGPKPPNPAELLASPRFAQLLEKLDQMYDLIIIDTPPILNVTDAAIVAQHVDGMILVIRAFATQREMLARAAELFQQTRTKVVGCILNNVDTPRGGYYAYDSAYYYGDGYYYSYYDDEDGNKRRRRRRRSRHASRSVGAAAAPGPTGSEAAEPAPDDGQVAPVDEPSAARGTVVGAASKAAEADADEHGAANGSR